MSAAKQRAAIDAQITQLQALRSAYVSCLGSVQGLVVMDDLSTFTGEFSNTFHEDPYRHAYNAGMRGAMLRLRSMLDSDRYQGMIDNLKANKARVSEDGLDENGKFDPMED